MKQKAFEQDSGLRLHGGYRIAVVSSLEDVGPWLADWEALARSAGEPNVFYSPWALCRPSSTWPATSASRCCS